ncbi:MAG: DUF4139 domain-containing protein [Campylobacteraceae bacterium]|nr:DUF4139 domain-containing protein [Campylobacteraceae bacterium]
MYKILLFLFLFLQSIFAQTQTSHTQLDIYKNISFMTKTYNIKGKKKIYISLPEKINLENIIIKSNKCTKENVTLSISKSFTSNEISLLKSKISDLSNKIDTLKEKSLLLKTISLKDKKNNEMEKTLGFFSKYYINTIEKITILKNRLDDANKKLKILQNQNARKFKDLSIDFTCNIKQSVSITYPQFDFKLRDFYEIKANSKTKTLTLSKKLKISQKSDEDFRDLNIFAHSNIYNQRVAPNPFYPRYINVEQNRRLLVSKNAQFNEMTISKKMRYNENFTTSSFSALHVNLPNNQEKIITLDKEIQPILFTNDIDGYSSSLAYLKVNFKSKKFYQSAMAYLYLDENKIGTRRLPNIQKNSNIDIYFGQNQNIKIKKILLKKFNKSEFFGNTKITTLVWQYKITNNSKILQKINLIERLPISQNENIEIKPLFDTKNAKIDKKGKTVWNFNLAPKRTKIIKFGYEVKKPKE